MVRVIGVVDAISLKDLDRGLRGTVWAALKAHGFTDRTERVAWREVDGSIDLVEIQVVGQYADALGCPPVSFSAYAACYPRFLAGTDPSLPARNGGPRPHYWHCDPFYRAMHKTIEQPWFRPFSTPPPDSMLPSFRLHREALMRVSRLDVHDLPDVWYVQADGSNLAENLDDMTSVVLSKGLDFLDTVHDSAALLGQLERGDIGNRDSPRSFYLSEAIREYLSAPPQSHCAVAHAASTRGAPARTMDRRASSGPRRRARRRCRLAPGASRPRPPGRVERPPLAPRSRHRRRRRRGSG
jgi:hypothetical protein